MCRQLDTTRRETPEQKLAAAEGGGRGADMETRTPSLAAWTHAGARRGGGTGGEEGAGVDSRAPSLAGWGQAGGGQGVLNKEGGAARVDSRTLSLGAWARSAAQVRA